MNMKGGAGPPVTAWQKPDRNPVDEWLAGKRPEDLDLVEVGGRRLYPDTLKRRSLDDPSVLEVVPVLIRAPSSEDKVLARLDALEWARNMAQGHGLAVDLPASLTIAQAEALLGQSYFDELDTKCLVARCTFSPSPPHDQYLLPQILDKRHDHASVLDLWDRITFWYDFGDVRARDLDDDAMIDILSAIDKVRNTTPLLAIAGSARDSLVVSMASQLVALRTAKSS